MRKTLYTLVVTSLLCLFTLSAFAFATVPNVNTDVGVANIAAGNTLVQLAPTATWHTYATEVQTSTTPAAPNDAGQAINAVNYEGKISIACGNFDNDAGNAMNASTQNTTADGQFIIWYSGHDATNTYTPDEPSGVMTIAKNMDQGAGYSTAIDKSTATNMAGNYATNTANVTARQHLFGQGTVNDAEIPVAYTYTVQMGRTSYGRANLHLRV